MLRPDAGDDSKLLAEQILQLRDLVSIRMETFSEKEEERIVSRGRFKRVFEAFAFGITKACGEEYVLLIKTIISKNSRTN